MAFHDAKDDLVWQAASQTESLCFHFFTVTTMGHWKKAPEQEVSWMKLLRRIASGSLAWRSTRKVVLEFLRLIPVDQYSRIRLRPAREQGGHRCGEGTLRHKE